MSDPLLAARMNGLVNDAIKSVDFQFQLEERGKQYRFHRYMLHHIRHRVASDDIAVQDNPRRLQMSIAVAAYDEWNDVVYVDASKLGNKSAGFSLVHEYTHAAVDVMKYVFTRASNEGVAFLVERLAMGFGTHIDHKNDPDIKGDPLAVSLFEEAEKLMMAKNLATDKTAQISAAEFKPLRDAVVAWYSATLGSLFQPDQVMDSGLGVKFPSGNWKNW